MSRRNKAKISDAGALSGLSKGELTRLKILKGATKVIAADGLHGLTYEKVAQASDSTRQLVQTYFPDREALFEACQRICWEAYLSHVVDAVEARAPQKTKLDAYVEASFRWPVQHCEASSLFALFHHFCITNATYRKANTALVDEGAERISRFLLEQYPELTKAELHERARSIQLLIAGSIYASLSEDRDPTTSLKLLKKAVQRILKAALVMAFVLCVGGNADFGLAANDCEESQRKTLGADGFFPNDLLERRGILSTNKEALPLVSEETDVIMMMPHYYVAWVRRTYVKDGLRTEVSSVETRVGIPKVMVDQFGGNAWWPKMADGRPLGADTAGWGPNDHMPLARAFRQNLTEAARFGQFMLARQQATMRQMLPDLRAVQERVREHYKRRSFGAEKVQEILDYADRRLFYLTLYKVYREASNQLVGTIGVYRAPYGSRDVYKTDAATGERVLLSADVGNWGPSFWMNHTGDPTFTFIPEGAQFEHVRHQSGDRALLTVPTERMFGRSKRQAHIYRVDKVEAPDGMYEVEWGAGDVNELTMYTVDRDENPIVRGRILMHLLDFAYDTRFTKEYNDSRLFLTYNDFPRLYTQSGFARTDEYRTINGVIHNKLIGTGQTIFSAAKHLLGLVQDNDVAGIQALLDTYDHIIDPG